MTTAELVPIIILLVAIVLSRFVMERALKHLSDDQRGRLIGSFSAYRLANTTIIFGLVLLFLLGQNYYPELTLRFTVLFVALFIGISVSISILSYRKLGQLDMPDNYVRSFMIGLLIQFIGIAVVFLPIAWRSVNP